MSDNCPVDECREVGRLRAALKWWAGTIIIIILAVGTPAMYTWARALVIPEIQEYSKAHENRITILEVQQRQILDNTEDIKRWIRSYHKGEN